MESRVTFAPKSHLPTARRRIIWKEIEILYFAAVPWYFVAPFISAERDEEIRLSSFLFIISFPGISEGDFLRERNLCAHNGPAEGV